MSHTPSKLLCEELAPFNAPDSELLAAIRFQGEVFAGVRVGGAGSDRHAWIYGRYGEHKDAAYEGFWAMQSAPNGAFARDLAISGAKRSDTLASPDLWVAPLGAPLALSWNIEGMTGGSISVEERVWNARTGVEAALSASTSAGAYCVWLRLANAATYRGLPPDFQSISGASPSDASLQWRDARTGRVYAFSPQYGVGALPPKDASGSGGELRAHYDELRAAGTLLKRPQWTGWLFETDASGAALTQQTEWSMVRLLVQDADGHGEWLSEHEVDAGACPGAALHVLRNGALHPQTLRASLRSIGAFKEIDGTLLVGAMEAGTDGRYASIIETPALSVDSGAARGQVQTSRRWCECALLNETVHALARFPDRAGGAIFGASSCELFERVDDLPPGERLVGSDPGGHSLCVAHPQSGRSFLARAVESDFSGNARSWPAHSYIVTKTALGQQTGPGVAALYNSVLWEWNGRVWGITDADPDLWANAATAKEKDVARTFQSLCWFDGATWHKVARWPRLRFTLTRGGSCGERMLLFGRRESDKRPACFRFDGQTLESNIELPYYVERADSAVSADGTRENLLLSCVKADPQASDNTVLPGFFLAETSGALDTDASSATGTGLPHNSVPHNAHQAFDAMPEGTVVFVGRFLPTSPLLRFALSDALSRNGRAMAAQFPCLWVLADASEPMPMWTGAPDEALLERMAAFDTRVFYGAPRSLKKPARKWLDVLVLIAPGFEWDTVIQPL